MTDGACALTGIIGGEGGAAYMHYLLKKAKGSVPGAAALHFDLHNGCPPSEFQNAGEIPVNPGEIALNLG
jgi:hypothetical protein